VRTLKTVASRLGKKKCAKYQTGSEFTRFFFLSYYLQILIQPPNLEVSTRMGRNNNNKKKRTPRKIFKFCLKGWESNHLILSVSTEDLGVISRR
jgi:hypothetical protein